MCGSVQNNLGRNCRGFSFLSVVRNAVREKGVVIVIAVMTTGFFLQLMASKVPFCYIGQAMGCEMTMRSLVALVVLGQH